MSLIDVSGGLDSPIVSTARLAGVPEVGAVRHFGPNAAFPELDFEPEAIAITADGLRAYVSLQEHNAVAELNLSTSSFSVVRDLGFKDHSLAGRGIDASDQDGAVAILSWPVFGMYQPGGISLAEIDGTTYLLSANEGKSRDKAAYSEESRVRDLVVDAPLAALQDDALLGRLEVTTTLGDGDGDLTYEALYAFGARSFSIWNPDDMSAPVFDSGGGAVALAPVAMTAFRKRSGTPSTSTVSELAKLALPIKTSTPSSSR